MDDAEPTPAQQMAIQGNRPTLYQPSPFVRSRLSPEGDDEITHGGSSRATGSGHGLDRDDESQLYAQNDALRSRWLCSRIPRNLESSLRKGEKKLTGLFKSQDD